MHTRRHYPPVAFSGLVAPKWDRETSCGESWPCSLGGCDMVQPCETGLLARDRIMIAQATQRPPNPRGRLQMLLDKCDDRIVRQARPLDTRRPGDRSHGPRHQLPLLVRCPVGCRDMVGKVTESAH